MKISIIVPAFNEEKLLVDSLRSIKKSIETFTAKGWQTELIVVDNNSTDRTAEIAQEQGAAVVFEPVNQISRARNKGAEKASGDWFLFIDADSYPSPELFGDVAEAIQSGNCVGGGSVIKFDVCWWYLDVVLMIRLWNLASRLHRWAAGTFIFCEAEAFRAVKGFSLELYASEEIRFSRDMNRLAKKQHKQFIILRRHPLLTSGRKIHLYSRFRFFKLIIRFLINPYSALKKKEVCDVWYDGKR